MPSHETKYDVAISFLDSDRALAQQLADMLSTRMSVFVFMERQNEIVGTDGETTFARVFGLEARLVVILHRNGWGSTRWTRIEETAIRGRGYEHGYDFALMIDIDRSAKPDWFPKHRIWLSLTDLGINGAAAIIELRAQDLGAASKPETLAERHQRSLRLASDLKARQQFQQSYEGVQETLAQVEGLRGALEASLESLNATLASKAFKVVRERDAVVVVGTEGGIRFELDEYYGNNLGGAKLTASIYAGAVFMRNGNYFNDYPRPVAILSYKPEGGDSVGFRWVEVASTSQHELSSEMIVEQTLKVMFDKIDESSARGFRKPRGH